MVNTEDTQTRTYPDGSIYQGEIEDDRRIGYGKLSMSDGAIYEGTWENDHFNEGILKYPNGDIFKGTFQSDGSFLTGIYCWSDGDTFEGEFKENHPNGEGFLKRKNGTAYKGQFKDGSYNGKGKLSLKGTVYDGMFLDGIPCGNVTIEKSDGRKATGNIHNWVFEGNVSLTTPEGESYIGECDIELRPSGMGILIRCDGVKYKGHFLNGIPQGKGELTLNDGRTIKANICDWIMSGFGDIHFPDGSRYEGPISDNLPNGSGTLIIPNYMRYEGNFDNGVIKGNGTFRFDNGATISGCFTDQIAETEGVFSLGGYTSDEYQHYNRDLSSGIIRTKEYEYSGEIYNGQPHGKGQLRYNGALYESDSFRGCDLCGDGRVEWPDGTVFEGKFRCINDAVGVIRHKDAEAMRCVLRNGKFSTGAEGLFNRILHAIGI